MLTTDFGFDLGPNFVQFCNCCQIAQNWIPPNKIVCCRNQNVKIEESHAVSTKVYKNCNISNMYATWNKYVIHSFKRQGAKSVTVWYRKIGDPPIDFKINFPVSHCNWFGSLSFEWVNNVFMDPHSHTGVLSQSADAQNSPPLYYTIIFRYWSNACLKILDTEVMPA